jgi:hypothetical protein
MSWCSHGRGCLLIAAIIRKKKRKKRMYYSEKKWMKTGSFGKEKMEENM